MKRLLAKVLIGISIGYFLVACQEKKSTVVESWEFALPQGGKYIFSAVSEEVIRVQYVNDSIQSDQTYAPISIATIPLSFEKKGDTYQLSTGSVMVMINEGSGSITFKDANGVTKMVDVKGLEVENDSTYFRFMLTDQEAVYGTGFRARPLNRRGEKLLVYNRPQYGYGWGEKNLNYTIPHWTSSNNYGLLIDNPARAVLDIGNAKSDELEYASQGGNLCYYFINGSDQKELLTHLTELTGRQPLPPRWAFGHLQSRFGYRNQQEAEQILAKAKAAGYPVDAIILDIYWFGPELEDGQMGRLDWDLERWPDPKGMIQRFGEQGVKTISVSEPFFTRKSKHYPYLSENKYLALNDQGDTYDIPDFYFGVGGLLDVFKSEASDWMWDQYQYIRSFGIDGLWVDLGEPEKHPHDMIHATGRASQVHGVYGHEWAKMLYEGYQKDFPNERLFHMGRSGFVGTQRYGLIPWTGDVGRGWSGLQSQLPAILSMGVSGLGYMHSDAGGFSMIDKGDPELYIRWLQLATFTSIFRPHADAVVPPEPVFWDQSTQDIIKPLIDFRYAMLPYHYTLAYENSQTGLPFVRPMIMEFPDASDTLIQQFMYGNDLLVAPVIAQGATAKKVFLPEGGWYDFTNGKSYTGGNVYKVSAELDQIPVFAKAGAIIPTSPGNQHAGTYSGDEVTLTYYVGDESTSSVVYFDDGMNPNAIHTNQFELMKTEVGVSSGGFTFTTVREGSFDGQSGNRKLTYRIVGLDQKPTGRPAEANWDEESKVLTYKLNCSDTVQWSLKR